MELNVLRSGFQFCASYHIQVQEQHTPRVSLKSPLAYHFPFSEHLLLEVFIPCM